MHRRSTVFESTNTLSSHPSLDVVACVPPPGIQPRHRTRSQTAHLQLRSITECSHGICEEDPGNVRANASRERAGYVRAGTARYPLYAPICFGRLAAESGGAWGTAVTRVVLNGNAHAKLSRLEVRLYGVTGRRSGIPIGPIQRGARGARERDDTPETARRGRVRQEALELGT
ncbi:hypothetical protein C8Q70DRAFT_234826 [Cubamyces menziesii]|nr:hypothetical protein C8Q70DRAFT_234826 [Cubamyces menziesii]